MNYEIIYKMAVENGMPEFGTPNFYAMCQKFFSSSLPLSYFIGKKLKLIPLPELYFGMPNVTIGNQYLIEDVEGSNFWIIDDDNRRTTFSHLRFITNNYNKQL